MLFLVYNMIIQLLDYKGKKFPIEVPDNTQKLHIKIISGDMILLEPIYFDTRKDSRSYDFNDGEYFIKKENFDACDSLVAVLGFKNKLKYNNVKGEIVDVEELDDKIKYTVKFLDKIYKKQIIF